MMRSMFSGVSSLKNHQIRMDVIGNNIANVNTVGYKADRVTFQEVFQQTIRAASAPTDRRGGTNPMQVGLGMTLGSIDTLHTETSFETTGLITDLAVDGNGFFVVNDGTRNFYTRAGLFDVDPEGYLTLKTNGFRVQGWQRENGVIDPGRNPGNIRIPIDETIPARATSNMTLAGNLTAESEVGHKVSILGTVRDSLGRAHQVTFEFTRGTVGPGGQSPWAWTALVTDANGNPISAGSGTITFDARGVVSGGGTGTLQWTPAPDAEQLEITVDFSGLTQYSLPTDAEVTGHDGRVAGSLETFTIDSSGVIYGVFTNGVIEELAQVALATFNNPGGLAKAGNTLFEPTPNSGEARIGAPGTANRGTIAPGALEMSNVDLSQEFTNMIVTQRGFQASSRIISTSDEMLQELVNLKR